jgi:hypothetical protein
VARQVSRPGAPGGSPCQLNRKCPLTAREGQSIRAQRRGTTNCRAGGQSVRESSWQ